MWDVEELIFYFSTLRRGYNRVEFQDRVKALGHIVNTSPLAPDDFDKLYRVWLQLEIPISTWMTIGTCLVPLQPVNPSLLTYTVKWLLAGAHNEVSVSRIGFVLNWLTAALDHNLIEAKELDKFYVIFHMIFQYDRYANHSAKLVYSLTKPTDVTRAWTQLLIALLKRRHSTRDKTQITALLSLYKSYRPECVPENVPAVSIRNAFPKINNVLLKRFERMSEYLNNIDSSCHLKWRTYLSEKGLLGRGCKVRRLVPDMEFLNIGSELYSGTTSKNFLHFKDGVKVLTHSLLTPSPRPAQLLSLLCNETGLVLLAAMTDSQHAFLSHDLLHQLEACLIRPDPWHGHAEKADLLCRVARLQQTLLQPVPVVSRFLAEYLPVWNGCHYFEQILALLEWIQPESTDELRTSFLAPISLLFATAPRLTQHTILATLTTSYDNMAYSATRSHQYFLKTTPRGDNADMLREIEDFIRTMCLRALRTYPGDSTVLDYVLCAYTSLARSQLSHAPGPAPAGLLPPPAAAAALASPSAHALDMLASLILLERKVYTTLRRRNVDCEQLASLLTRYRHDIANCLQRGTAVTHRSDGLILNTLPSTVAERLTEIDGDKGYTIGRHIALAPYTYMRCEGVTIKKITDYLWLQNVVKNRFKGIAALLERTGRKSVVC